MDSPEGIRVNTTNKVSLVERFWTYSIPGAQFIIALFRGIFSPPVRFFCDFKLMHNNTKRDVKQTRNMMHIVLATFAKRFTEKHEFLTNYFGEEE
jgi:hypothetical protein